MKKWKRIRRILKPGVPDGGLQQLGFEQARIVALCASCGKPQRTVSWNKTQGINDEASQNLKTNQPQKICG